MRGPGCEYNSCYMLQEKLLLLGTRLCRLGAQVKFQALPPPERRRRSCKDKSVGKLSRHTAEGKLGLHMGSWHLVFSQAVRGRGTHRGMTSKLSWYSPSSASMPGEHSACNREQGGRSGHRS